MYCYLYNCPHDCLNHTRYQAVFGPTLGRKSTNLDERNGDLITTWDLDEKERVCSDDENGKLCSYVEVGNSNLHLKNDKQ